MDNIVKVMFYKHIKHAVMLYKLKNVDKLPIPLFHMENGNNINLL